VREKKAKRDKKQQRKEKNMPTIERGVKNSKHETIQVETFIYFIYFILPCRDGFSKAQRGLVDPPGF
jgi:hypothetical protein